MPLDVWDFPPGVEPENEVFPPQMVEAVERFAEDHGWEPLDVLCYGVMFFIQRAYDKNTRMARSSPKLAASAVRRRPQSSTDARPYRS